jgi:hypothetical protein
VFTALVLSGLLILSACSSGKAASHIAIRVCGVVHVGPYTQVLANRLPANTAAADVVEGFREGQVLWDRSARHPRCSHSVRRNSDDVPSGVCKRNSSCPHGWRLRRAPYTPHPPAADVDPAPVGAGRSD